MDSNTTQGLQSIHHPIRSFNSELHSTPVPPVNPGQPFVQAPPKRSNGGIIAGLVLILMGGVFLLHELDFFSFWQIHRFWPLVFVFVGIALIVSGQQKKPWDHHDWNKNASPADALGNDPIKTDNSSNDNNPTV
jgi:phage shock protein C